MIPIYRDVLTAFTLITVIPAIYLWLSRNMRWKLFEFVPPIIWVLLTPMVLSTLNVIPRESHIYQPFRSVAASMLIFLMLLDIDIRKALRVTWRAATVFSMGALGVVVGTATAFSLLKHLLPVGSCSALSGLAAGWIGGTAHMVAVSAMLSTPNEQMGMIIVADTLVFSIYFPLIIMSKRWAYHFDRFTRAAESRSAPLEPMQILPPKPAQIEVGSLLFVVGLSCLATLLASKLGQSMPDLPPILPHGVWPILIVTTFALLLSATPLRLVAGARPFGSALAYMYICTVGASSDLESLATAPVFVLAAVICVIIHLAFVVIAARMFRVDIATAAVSSVAGVGGIASAPVAASHYNHDLVPIAIMLSIIGYALATYLGFMTFSLCQLFS